jgi:hypothetical protein
VTGAGIGDGSITCVGSAAMASFAASVAAYEAFAATVTAAMRAFGVAGSQSPSWSAWDPPVQTCATVTGAIIQAYAAITGEIIQAGATVTGAIIRSNAMKPFKIKSNDTNPPLRLQLIATSGTPLNLSALTITGVRFTMKLVSGDSLQVNATAEVESASTGLLRYVWIAGDTALPGTYDAEFEVTTSTWKQTFPSTGSIRVIVEPDINQA